MAENDGLTLELSTKQVAVTMLLTGLVIGGIGGFTAAEINSNGNAETQPKTQNTDQNTDESPKEVFREISNDLELDTDTVMHCYSNSSNSEALEDRRNAVSNLGGFGTPTFFVGNRENGFVKITGAQPLPRFEQAFETVRSGSGNLTSLEGIEFDGEPNKGEDSAPIKVVEYNEFGCPFCSEWNGFDASSRTPINQLQIADSLENQYVDTGEVQLISKDYPVPQLHPNGPKAHRAANCVYEHEKSSYWSFHDQLFQKRDQWMQG